MVERWEGSPADPSGMFQITSRGRYAVGAVLHIALHGDASPVPLAEISDCQDISTSYIDQLFAALRPVGIIEGIPGPGGGYRLGRPAERICVAQIISAVEVQPPEWSFEACRSPLEGAVWMPLMDQIEGLLSCISVADLIERPAIQDWLRRQYGGSTERTGQWRCSICGTHAERGLPGCAAGIDEVRTPKRARTDRRERS